MRYFIGLLLLLLSVVVNAVESESEHARVSYADRFMRRHNELLELFESVKRVMKEKENDDAYDDETLEIIRALRRVKAKDQQLGQNI